MSAPGKMNVSIHRSSSSRVSPEGNETPVTSTTKLVVGPRPAMIITDFVTLEHLETLLILARERGAPWDSQLQFIPVSGSAQNAVGISTSFAEEVKPGDGE